MSSGLMSCVRENSPPIEMVGETRDSTSLPASPASTPTNAPSTEHQKRRRFHPLRNLRRIFRRRTLNSSDASTSPSVSTSPIPAATSQSNNDYIYVPTLTVSSPSSPLQHQQIQPETTAAPTETVPAHSPNTAAQTMTMSSTALTTATTTHHHHHHHHHQQTGLVAMGRAGNGIIPTGGVSVFSTSTSVSGGFYRKEKLKGGESISDLDESREMTDSQRSFSEGRLVDSDFNRDSLSHSHDSVFSESATASSLSIVLKAELADVLRKRRNRPDASDEDLGLPRSPTTPQRRDNANHIQNQSEVSSLSMLSMISSDMDEETTSTTTTANQTIDSADRTVSSMSSKFSQDTSRTSDEIDLSVTSTASNGSRLSHSAARHKMAVRPKKKGPTRYKRPIESTALPPTPELNEDLFRVASLDVKDLTDKMKSRSLPPGVNAKILEQHSTREVVTKTVSVKRSKTEKGRSSNITKSSTYDSDLTASTTPERKDDDDESGFFRRFLNRGSKRATKPGKDECDESKTTTSNEAYSQKVEETRKEIRREMMTEGKTGLSAMLNNFILSTQTDSAESLSGVNKPRSGPAARQRFIPKDLSSSPLPALKTTSDFLKNESETVASQTLLTRSQTEESFQSTTLVREISAKKEHFEKKERTQPKIIGLSPFQQKISRSNDSMSSPTDTAELLSVQKQRKSVEKSKSFRSYTENQNAVGGLKTNMPSLPDLTFTRRLTITNTTTSTTDDLKTEDLSLGFEINDNNLIKQKPEPLPLCQGIYTKNIILTTSKPMPPKSPKQVSPACNKDIDEIEESIDQLVKSPFITVLRKSQSGSESIETNKSPLHVSIAPMVKESSKYAVLLDSGNKNDTAKYATFSESTKSLNEKPSQKYAIRHSESTKSVNELISAANKNSASPRGEEISIPLRHDRKSLSDLTKLNSELPTPKMSTSNKARRSSSVIESDNTGVPEFMKIQLNRVDPIRPKSNIVLSKNAKEINEDLTKRLSNESVDITESKPPKSPVKKTDEESVVMRQSPEIKSNSSKVSLLERRKLFNEEVKTERKSSIEEETGVILRKKSFVVSNNNNNDPTPELMKVFARRSLKIKDDDLPLFSENGEKLSTLKKSSATPNVDSDKENQSSSEEKLDKLPKVDSHQTQSQSENRNSLADFRNKPQANNNNGNIAIPAKNIVSSVAAVRNGGGGYRPTASIFSKSLSMTEHISSVTSERNINNNVITNNGVLKASARHTIGSTTSSTTTATSEHVSHEFKGIHQRRAEWEKRAKEALK